MSEKVVDIRHVSRRFSRKLALDDVSLQIPAGCVFGLVGENGAGKTTLLKHVLGLYKPQVGEVRVFDRSPVSEPVEVLGQIGYLSEDRALPAWMRVAELMDYTAAFYPAWDNKYADELRSTFKLDGKQRVQSLSRGGRARVGLLLALAHRPQLLVLDEPSSGLDPVVRRDILGAIIRTVADEGRTVFFSSHLLDEVQRVSDFVAILHEGRLLLSAPLEQLLAAHQRLIVRFPDSLSVKPTLPGVIRCHGEGREWTVICNGQWEAMEEQLKKLQGEVVERATPSLDEIFVARIQS